VGGEGDDEVGDEAGGGGCPESWHGDAGKQRCAGGAEQDSERDHQGLRDRQPVGGFDDHAGARDVQVHGVGAGDRRQAGAGEVGGKHRVNLQARSGRGALR
jgi:hypothetical protein